MKERDAVRKMLKENPQFAQRLHSLVKSGKLKSANTIPDDEEVYVVCGPDPGGVTGSKRLQCVCGALMWLSPSSQELMATRKGKSTPICIKCLQEQQ